MIKLIISTINKKYFINMKNYIEGIMSNNSFVELFLSKKNYKILINISRHFDNYKNPLDSEFDKKLKENKDDFYVMVRLQNAVHCCLDFYRIKHNINATELKLWKKWSNYIPSFLNSTYELICELEKLDPERKHTKKWYKDYFLQKYKCKNKPPVWIQWGEWPMDDDGEPCLFLYQTGYPNRHDFIEYHFRKKNGEEVIIEQYF